MKTDYIVIMCNPANHSIFAKPDFVMNTMSKMGYQSKIYEAYWRLPFIIWRGCRES